MSEEILTIGQIFANSRTIQQNPCVIAHAKCSDFEQISESVWNSQETFLGENRKLLQYICPMYFLRNRNYDLFNLKFLPRGFVQIIRIEGVITPAELKW